MYRSAEAALASPDGIVCDVVFPTVPVNACGRLGGASTRLTPAAEGIWWVDLARSSRTAFRQMKGTDMTHDRLLKTTLLVRRDGIYEEPTTHRRNEHWL